MILGGEFTDILMPGASGSDTINGGPGDDRIYEHSDYPHKNSEEIFASLKIYGDTGFDTLILNNSEDTYILREKEYPQ